MTAEPEQLALVRGARARLRTATPKALEPLAPNDPVARVAVDVPLPHLDRLFDYAVPASMDAEARAGCRVRVRFSGRLVDGFVVERRADSEHVGTLARLARATSPEPVLAPEVLELARQVADHYGGVLADVLRLAVPPRHAAAEAKASPVAADLPDAPDAGPWADYQAGAAFLGAVADGRAPLAVWTALPGPELAGRRGHGGSGGPLGGAWRARRRPRRARCRAGVACRHGGLRAGTARRADGRARPCGALPEVLGRTPRGRPLRRGHPRGPVRPRPRPRAGGGVGRRRRPPRGAARALPARARGPAASRPGGGSGLPGRGPRDDGRGSAPPRLRCGARHRSHASPRAREGATRACGRRRRGAGSRCCGPIGTPPAPGVDDGERCPAERPGARAGAAARLPALARLRHVPGTGALRGVRRAARAGVGAWRAPLPLVRANRRSLLLPLVRRDEGQGPGRRSGAYGRGARAGFSWNSRADVRARRRAVLGAGRGGARRRHPGCGAGRRGRLCGGVAARRLGTARSSRPPSRRGDPATLVGGGRPGPARPGRRARRW